MKCNIRAWRTIGSSGCSTIRMDCFVPIGRRLRSQMSRRYGSWLPNSSLFQGVFPIVVTPFRNDKQETLDIPSFCRSLLRLADIGVQGVTIMGVLGESNRMTESERHDLIVAAKTTIQEQIRSPFALVVGTSHTGTASTLALCKMAQELGADAVMVAPSKDGLYQPSNEVILEFYLRIANECPNLPMVVQDHPSSTGVQLSLDLLVDIVTQIPSVQCIKLESLPTVNRLAALRDNKTFRDRHRNCSILTGLGALYAGFDLEQGTNGFMTGFAFPEILMAMNNYAQKGQYEQAHALYAKFLPLIVLEQQQPGGLAIRKEIYRLRGWIDCSHLRHPGTNLSDPIRNALLQQIKRSLPNIDITKPLPLDVLHV